MEIDTDKVVQRLSEAIQIKTISEQDLSLVDLKPLLIFHTLLEKSYPNVHQHLERQVINGYSLCYQWTGNNPELEPIAFLAHMDVVPVDSEKAQEWHHEPFSGKIADGFVWGRGTLDMKGTLMAIMEAVEKLLEQGFRPERSIYLAFGHDEEIGGKQGANQIARHLKEKGIKFAYTLDEGMVILNPELSPTNKMLGVIGIAEKGYVTLRLKAKGKGGHSSSPPRRTVIGKLCHAAARLENRQMPPFFSDPVTLFFQTIAPEMALGKRVLFKNMRLFSKLLFFILGKSETTNALIRTTTAPTMIHGGIKENILPTEAHLFVNFRLLPGDTIANVVEHVRKSIRDKSIEVEICRNLIVEPPPVSSADSTGFTAIRETIRQVFPETSVSAGLVLATTDSRHYAEISRNCYRFSPFIFGPEDPARIHGTNERISIKGYIRGIRYFIQLIKNAGK